jgi:DNA-binding GntR family transcriptional regulator
VQKEGTIMPKLAALNQPESLAKMAYDALHKSILTGELKPGEVYTEKGLAEELGISRTPVREALLELASHELVVFLPRKGVMINRFTERDVEEIFELRKIIETAAAEKVAKFSQAYDLYKLEEALNQQQKALEKKDYNAFLQADRLFHTICSDLTNNRRLVGILENLRDMIQVMGILALGIHGRAEQVVVEHENILAALKKGEPAKAREMMERHLDLTKEAIGEGMLRKLDKGGT